MDEKIIGKQLKKVLGEASGAIMPNELKEVFDIFLNLMKELKVYLELEIAKGDEQIPKLSDSILSQMRNVESKMSELISMRESMDGVYKDMNIDIADLKNIRKTMLTAVDLDTYESKLSELKDNMRVIKDTMLDTPTRIRNKLESIKTESEKLDIEAIGYLRKELDELKKIRSTGKSYSLFGGGGGGGTSGGRTVQAYDLSASLNGVLKSFTLPAFWRILSVHSSSFPFIFRPTTDYTVSGTTITFTSEVEASSTLNTGQSLIILYAE